MATKVKEGGHLREKPASSPSTHQNIDAPHGRRTSKSASSESSPEREISTKPVPNYLKPTLSSGGDVGKHGKKQHPETSTAAKRPPSRKSLEKLPSPLPSPQQKTHKSSSPSPKTGVSPTPISDRTTKTPTHKAGHPHSSSKSRTPPPNAGSNVRRKESVDPAIGGTTVEPYAADHVSANRSEEEETEPSTDPKVNVEKLEDGEQSLLNVQTVQDPMPHAATDSSHAEEPVDATPRVDELEPAPPTPQKLKVVKDETASSVENGEIKENEGRRVEGSEAGGVPELQGVEPTKESNTEKPKVPAPEGLADVTEINHDEGSGEGREESKSTEKAGGAGEAKEGAVPKQQRAHGKEKPVYNDVIEETASKLVEKRKSKVKALVGAFETVMTFEEPDGPSQQ